MRKTASSNHFYLLIILALAYSCSPYKETADDMLIYKDVSRSIDQRTDDLLARITLDEKNSQIKCMWLTKFKLYDHQGELVADSML